MVGIAKSSKMSEKVSSPNARSATSPSSTARTEYPRASRIVLTTFRIEGLSSTTRIRALIFVSLASYHTNGNVRADANARQGRHHRHVRRDGALGTSHRRLGLDP